jgi:hypothetical protein
MMEKIMEYFPGKTLGNDLAAADLDSANVPGVLEVRASGGL